MTPKTQSTIKNASLWLTALLGVLGWAFTSGWSALDHRFVHASEYRVKQASDSLSRISDRREDEDFKRSVITKLDSVNLRITQIQCGERVTKGCR